MRAEGEGATEEGATEEGATGEGATEEGATGEGATGEGATEVGAGGGSAGGEGGTADGGVHRGFDDRGTSTRGSGDGGASDGGADNTGADHGGSGAGPRLIVAGVDGGGSKTRTVIADETGRVLGTADGPASAVRAGAVGGAEHSADVVAAGVRDALGAAGLAGARVQALVAGVAGTGREPERAALWQALSARAVADEVSVVPDASIALDDAFGEGPGVLLIAGTGSVAFGRGPDGAFARAGGWGPVLGDEGSGGWLGRRALNMAVAAADGREPDTALLNALLGALGLDDAAGLVPWAARAKPVDFAALAPVIGRVAAAGDLRANSLLTLAVEELALHVRTLARRLFVDERAAVPVALAGGLLTRGSGVLRKRLEQRLRAAVPGAQLRQEAVDPARGAVRGALRLLGVDVLAS